MPIIGWALEPLMRLDRAGARGLVSDLMVSSPLRRQAAFATAAEILKHGQPALDALCAPFGLATSDVAVGQMLRQHRARDVIGALYGVQPSALPGGYLRALLRVQEARAEGAGIEPFAEPTAYRRLFEIYTQDGHGLAAQALRYVGRLRALHLRAVDELDSVLILPEVLQGMHGPDTILAANRLLELLRVSVPSADDIALKAALRQSLGRDEPLRQFGCRMLERADRLPVPDLPPLAGLRVLASAAEVEQFAEEMSNCAASYLVEVAIGLKLICAYDFADEAGATVPLAILLAPMTDGGWEIDQIAGKNNEGPAKPVLRAALQRLMSIGLRVSGPAPGGVYDRRMAELLGHHPGYRYGDTLADALGEPDRDLPGSGGGGAAKRLAGIEEALRQIVEAA
ncbi:hypothetical protein [Methylobacterium sp. yr668]|uniref:hypothetical protein n=1 Tax=Methylobacterium sp. yr668 TaxID=1761801 RepID=UPI001114E6B4|nr:hypothetical protein [Methylobacterium sp. yr668]